MLYSKTPLLSNPRKKVILIIFSGLTTDLFTLSIKLNNDHQLSFMSHRSILPALPVHNLASILTGVPLEFHGVSCWKNKLLITPVIQTQYEKFPSLFYVVKQQLPKLKLWMETNNAEVFNLVEKSLLDDYVVKASLDYEFNVVDPQLGVIYDDDLFIKGVNFGFSSDEYQKCLQDKVVSLNNLIENNLDTTFIIASTSGGFHQGIDNQGGLEEKEVIVPLILRDPYLPFKRKKIILPTSNVDIVAIVSYFLRINLIQPASKGVLNLLVKAGVV